MAKIILIYGSQREGREGINVAEFLKSQLGQRGHDVSLIDPLEYDLKLDVPITYKKELTQKEKQLKDLFEQAEGFLICTAEYNHSYPGALKNILDNFYSEYDFKPSAICSYSTGVFGGVRAAVSLREPLAALGTVSIPMSLNIPSIGENFKSASTQNQKVIENTGKFLDQFEWYIKALKEARN